MKKSTLKPLTERMYANNGQHLEQVYRFNKSGEIRKADNLKGCDYENVQIKSARATICKGTDLKAHIENDVATVYAYITKDLECYEMSKSEYLEFCEKFATVTRESSKNGGAFKMRLKSESKDLLEWLKRKA